MRVHRKTSCVRPGPYVAGVALVFAAAATSLAAGALEQVKASTEEVLGIVQDPELKDREAEREKRACKAIDRRFDWRVMARGAMGPEWRDLTPKQADTFTHTFADLIRAAYMDTVMSYSGEKIEYVAERVDGKYGVVKTVLITRKGTRIPVDYRVLKTDEKWLIYDVIVEGVSMVNNYRKQISSIMIRSKFDELIEKIKDKAEQRRKAREEKKPDRGSRKEDK